MRKAKIVWNESGSVAFKFDLWVYFGWMKLKFLAHANRSWEEVANSEELMIFYMKWTTSWQRMHDPLKMTLNCWWQQKLNLISNEMKEFLHQKRHKEIGQGKTLTATSTLDGGKRRGDTFVYLQLSRHHWTYWRILPSKASRFFLRKLA